MLKEAEKATNKTVVSDVEIFSSNGLEHVFLSMTLAVLRIEIWLLA